MILEETIGCYRTALALRPAASAAHINLGIALQAKNQLDEAIAEYQQGHRTRPQASRSPTTTSASHCEAKNQLDEAIAEYRKAIELDPKYAVAHNNLGNALRAKNQLDEAIAEYRKAIELDPKLALAHNNLGIALQAKNQLDEAIAEYRKAIELDPKLRTWPTTTSAYALQAKNQLDEAIAEFHKAIELDPKFATWPTTTSATHCRPRTSWTRPSPNTGRPSNSTPSSRWPTTTSASHCMAKNQLDEAIAEYQQGHRSSSGLLCRGEL